MALVTCKLCRKIFTAAGGRTCPACKKRLDDLYMKVRDFLRDNPKMEFNVDTLSTSLDADIRDVQALVDMGYLDRESTVNLSNEKGVPGFLYPLIVPMALLMAIAPNRTL